MRTYRDLSLLETLDERFEYLSLDSEVGYATFGYDRWANQSFYHSSEWKQARSFVIARDEGNDMGLHDYPISGPPHVHHLNPLTIEDLECATENLFDPEFLITVSLRTHNAIHFGDRTHLPRSPVARASGDTNLW
jgi:hypothetical protein